MADETTTETKLPKVEPVKQIDPPEGKPPIVFGNPEPETAPATEMLAAAHEKYLGADVAIHEGKPETGIGSKFHKLHPAKKAHLAAIEHLIVVEAEHAAAEAHLASIHARVEHAMKRVEATEEASDEITAKEEAEKAEAEKEGVK